MKTDCVELPTKVALEFWDELEPYVEEALVHDITRSTSVEDIHEQLEKGYSRVLVCAKASGILSATVIQCFINRRDERILHVICTAGEGMHEWLPTLIDKLGEVAALEECDAITMMGRPGWSRKLNQFGFRTEIVNMRLETDGRTQQLEHVGERQLSVVR